MADNNNDLSEGMLVPRLDDAAPARLPTAAELDQQMEDLRVRLSQLELQRKELADRERKEALSRIREIWRTAELTTEEVLSVDPFGHYQKPATPKAPTVNENIKAEARKRTMPSGARVMYSAGPGLDWSGKSRKPAWVQQIIDDGGNIEDYRVD